MLVPSKRELCFTHLCNLLGSFFFFFLHSRLLKSICQTGFKKRRLKFSTISWAVCADACEWCRRESIRKWWWGQCLGGLECWPGREMWWATDYTVQENVMSKNTQTAAWWTHWVKALRVRQRAQLGGHRINRSMWEVDQMGKYIRSRSDQRREERRGKEKREMRQNPSKFPNMRTWEWNTFVRLPDKDFQNI